MAGRSLLPLTVSIAKIIMGLNMSMVLLDKSSESLLGTSLLLLLSDKIESFSRAILMSLSRISVTMISLKTVGKQFATFITVAKQVVTVLC